MSWIALWAAVVGYEVTSLAQEPTSILERPEVKAAANALLDALPDSQETGKIAVRIRIPAEMIVGAIDRDYTHNSPVDRVVLGTHSRGQAVCQGHVQCILLENTKGAHLQCDISGRIDSATCGTNGPAIIHSQAATSFTANKPIYFDGAKFSSRPAIVHTRTSVTITGIDSTAPRLRGRIVRRVAAKRAAESLPQAQAITAQLTQEELCEKINVEFDQRIAALNQKLEERFELLGDLSAKAETLVSVQSFVDCLEVTLAPADAPLGSTPLRSREATNQNIELWLHFYDGNLPNVAVASMVASVPKWLSAYFRESEALARLSERKINIQRQGNWLVVQLIDTDPATGKEGLVQKSSK